MKSLLTKVQSATKAMGKGPYNDKETMEYAEKISRRTSALCEKLRALKNEKQNQGTHK